MIAATDADLLARYLHDRDDAAFAAIVRKHGPMVYAVCRRITAHHHDAEDAFQACFVVLAARAEVVRPAPRLGAWLHGVAVRCARKARDARPRSASTPVEPAVIPVAVEPDLPGLIDDALAAIPEAYRAAVVLCHLEGRSRNEAARELGWSEGTLSGRLHRALELLAKRLTARGVTATGAMLLAVWSARGASASVPAALTASTCSAASLLTAGFTEHAGPVAALAHGVIHAMSFRKLKLAAAVLLGVVGVGSFAALNRAEAKPADGRAARRNAPVPGEKKLKEWKEAFAVKHEHAITAVASNPDLLAVGDGAGGLKLYETKAGAEFGLVLKSKEKDGKPIIALQFTPDGKWMFLAAQDGTMVARSDVTKKVGNAGGVGGGRARWIGFSADGLTWVEQDRPHLITLRHSPFDLNWKGEPFVTVEEPDGKAITHTSLSADDKVFALASDVPVVRVFDRGTNKEQHKIVLKEGQKLSALKLSDDGKRLAVVGEKGFAKVYDADNGAELCELAGHEGTVHAVAFTPDGKEVATANGKTVRVFDAKSGKLLGEIKGHEDDVTAVAFTPDGKRLVTGSKDKTAKVWER